MRSGLPPNIRPEGLCHGQVAKSGYRTELWCISFFALICMSFLTCFSGWAMGAEDPDVLYEKGRFAEAEKIYAGSDMDHPNDLRYRYNRGCAAYQNSDYQGAMAAFSSVLSRARAEKKGSEGRNNQLLFNTAYNLGNTAFKQGDFQSAAAYYKQALLYDSKSEDVQYNLELTLREAEKQKKQEKEEKDQQTQQDSDQSQGKDSEENRAKSGEGGESEKPLENQPDKESNEASDSEKEDKGGEGDFKKAEQDQPEDLSGELSPLKELPENKEEDQASVQETPEPGSKEDGVDRKKAGAVLDNIKEDPSRLLKYQFREETRRGVGSGKDW